MPATRIHPARKRIVIVGAGFAGLEVARALTNSACDVTLIDRQNFHLFQPLLYQVATAALSPADIAEPVRRMLRTCPNVEVVLGEVTGIRAEDRALSLANGKVTNYDILVLAAGATHAYYGHEDWEAFAPGIKTIADARSIRSRLLLSFERAETCDDPAERKRLTTFVVVGGGPSGVELAGSIAELARHTLAKDFHHIDPKATTVILLEAGPRILSAFPKMLSNYAVAKLGVLGVTVRENCSVQDITALNVETDGETIPAGLTIWAAGVKAVELGKLLGAPTDKSGRIEVGVDLSVPGFADVYALGDIAVARDAKGRPFPGLAQVAKQEGQYLGRALAARLHSEAKAPPFIFRDKGNVAIIGRHAAVMDLGWMRVTGTPAWLLWALIHIYLLAGLQHRLLVAIQWLWRYATYDRGARLIVEPILAPCRREKPAC
jgi:NADH dehydrogenase